MKKPFARPEGYSINEMLIVIMILVALVSATISGTGKVLKDLNFSNDFNRIVFMVQEARNMAQAGRQVIFPGRNNPEPAYYEVDIDVGTGNAVTLNAIPTNINPDVAGEIKNRVALDHYEQGGTECSRFCPYGNDISEGNISCTGHVYIRFIKSGEMRTNCPGGIGGAKILEIDVQTRKKDGSITRITRSQKLTITRSTGLIQVGKRTGE